MAGCDDLTAAQTTDRAHSAAVHAAGVQDWAAGQMTDVAGEFLFGHRQVTAITAVALDVALNRILKDLAGVVQAAPRALGVDGDEPPAPVLATLRRLAGQVADSAAEVQAALAGPDDAAASS